MKKLTTTLLLSLSFFVFTTIIYAQEKWEIEMQKDFSKVLNARKDAPQQHREYIVKWRKKWTLADVTLLYEAQKSNYDTNAAYIYGWDTPTHSRT